MAKKVTKIQAVPNCYSVSPARPAVKRRACGYARVSTDKEEQESSFENQMRHYTTYIQSRNDLEFVGMYSDEGVTGTSMKKRSGFNKMIEDALDGKIDLIITKSVSRFARNTVDSLTTIRKLKEKGVEVYFEEQNIYTFDSKGELLITIMSSLAQEEAHNISDNTKWGRRKRFADGQVSVAYSRFLGYDKGPNGEMVINPEQAKTVKQIYEWFLDGLSSYAIAKRLTEMGIPTPSGKVKWQTTTIISILSNEKYKGDALLQKQYTEDFISKKKVKNDGSRVPQYYVEDNHEAIIDSDTFNEVQAEMQRRRMENDHYRGASIFTKRVKCGDCGGWYGPKTCHSTEKYRKTIYRCNQKYDGEKKCTSPSLNEEQIKEVFIAAINKLVSKRRSIIKRLGIQLAEIENTTDITNQMEELTAQLESLNSLIQAHVAENAHSIQNQGEYQQRYTDLASTFADTKRRYEELAWALNQRKSQISVLKQTISTLKEIKEPIQEFDKQLWCNMVDFITAYSETDIRVTIKYGEEIKV